MRGELFEKYLDFFLTDNPFVDCPKAGHAAYGQGVAYLKDEKTGRSVATSSYFMSYHSILKTSRDYIDAMEEARLVGENITKTLNSGIDFFPN